MLTAISPGWLVPKGSPIGQWNESICAAEIPSASNSRFSTERFALLPMKHWVCRTSGRATFSEADFSVVVALVVPSEGWAIRDGKIGRVATYPNGELLALASDSSIRDFPLGRVPRRQLREIPVGGPCNSVFSGYTRWFEETYSLWNAEVVRAMKHTFLRRSCLLLSVAAWGLFQVGCQESSPKLPADNQVVADSDSATLTVPSASEQSPEAAEEIIPPPVFSVSKPVLDQDELPPGKIHNVILIIGDGMGPQQLGMLFAYAHLAPGSTVPDRTPAIELMARQGAIALVRTEPYGAVVVDSAAAATQLASGEMAGSEMIGANYLGQSVPTVLEIAKQMGKSTGLVSDTRITHATPAAFAAHQPHRSMENEIASDMLENQVDVLMSGGLRHWIPQAANDKNSPAYLAVVQMIGGLFEPDSKRRDNRNLLVEARQNYQLVFDRTALAEVKAGRVLGLFANSEMVDAIAERNTLESEDRTQPTLAEMTGKALEVLSQNPKGFFLMVEGGQIDWCGHNNDAGCLLQELLQLDDAVRLVHQWAKDRDDTLVLVTGDHETGSFGFSYSGTPLPESRTLDGDVFQGTPFEPIFNFATAEVLDHLHGQQQSFYHIFDTFDALDEREKTPDKLMQMVNESVAPFSITLADAVEILTRMPNRQYAPGHPYLGTRTVPKMPDQEAFYVYGENGRMNYLAHILGAQQSVVWGTGTHTNTPVALITYGPAAATQRFTGFMHATDIGKGMITLIRGE